jgi:hypothetical protein
VDLVLFGTSVVDVVDGSVRTGQTLEIDGGRILRMFDGPPDPGVRARRTEDAGGRWAIPGLWDMHVHALWDEEVASAFLPAFTRAGVTGIRDMGGSLEVLRRTRLEPDPLWPRIVAAGRVLDGPEPVDPSISEPLTDAAAAREAVARLQAEGVDFVKVYTLLPRDAFFAAADAAAAAGLPLVGHVPAAVTPLEAAGVGLASLEHLRDELGGLCADLPEAECQALPDKLAEMGTHVTPTLAILEAKTIPGYLPPGAEPDLDDLPQAVAEYWSAAKRDQRDRGDRYFAAKRAGFEQRLATIRRLRETGVPVLAGSDTGNPFVLPGEGLHRELELLVAAGLSPREALFSATLGAARFLGLSEIGELRPGYHADLVLLDGNPLEEIGNVGRVAGVVRAGRLVKPR